MKGILGLLLLTSIASATAIEFPTAPNEKLTPGSLCDKPVRKSYQEGIGKCKRDVSSATKAKIFEMYRKELGYTLPPTQRQKYKIDHYFPLCAGGSNKVDNLWPQHATLYRFTDPIEQVGCEKLSLGKIKQQDLLNLVKEAKADVKKAPAILKKLERM